MTKNLEPGKIYKVLQEFHFFSRVSSEDKILVLNKDELVLILNIVNAKRSCGNWTEFLKFLILSGQHKGNEGFRRDSPTLKMYLVENEK